MEEGGMEAAASTMATLAAGQSNMDYWSSLIVQVGLGRIKDFSFILFV